MAEAGTSASWRVERLGVVESTQELLRARLEAGQDVDRLVLRATAQTRGRGRRERGWQSGHGGSYQSAALRDERGELRSPRVPLQISVGIAEALRDFVEEIALKWPNDLYLRRLGPPGPPRTSLPGKVGGVLCQHLGGHLLVGVGLNVRNEVPPEAASLDRLEPDEVSELVLRGIDHALTEIDPLVLPERYAPLDLLHGRRLRVKDGAREHTGIAAGIGVSGCLHLAGDDGTSEICSGRIVEFDAAVNR